MIEVLRDTGLFPFQNYRLSLSHRKFAHQTMVASTPFFPCGFRSRSLWPASLVVYLILLSSTIASAASATGEEDAPQTSTSHSTRPTRPAASGLEDPGIDSGFETGGERPGPAESSLPAPRNPGESVPHLPSSPRPVFLELKHRSMFRSDHWVYEAVLRIVFPATLSLLKKTLAPSHGFKDDYPLPFPLEDAVIIETKSGKAVDDSQDLEQLVDGGPQLVDGFHAQGKLSLSIIGRVGENICPNPGDSLPRPSWRPNAFMMRGPPDGLQREGCVDPSRMRGGVKDPRLRRSRAAGPGGSETGGEPGPAESSHPEFIFSAATGEEDAPQTSTSHSSSTRLTDAQVGFFRRCPREFFVLTDLILVRVSFKNFATVLPLLGGDATVGES